MNSIYIIFYQFVCLLNFINSVMQTAKVDNIASDMVFAPR